MFKFRKAGSDVLNDLDAYLQLIGDEPARWLERQVRSWGEFSYDELADLIASGDTQLINWQSRYAQVVNERFNPLWLSAIQAASHAATRGRITIDDSDVRVKEFLRTRAAEFVQELSDESKRAVANVILYGQSERMSYRQIAQLVRPLIGLNSRQAQANVNYRQRVYNKLIDAGLSPSTADARAGTSTSKYAAKQHRFRAETIVHTELARAYNRGAYDGVKAAIDAKLMNHCEMVWSTAGTNRVCSRCLELKDTVVGYTNEVGVTLPPLHPRCRCVIIYRESSRSTRGNIGSTTDALTTPYPTGRGYRSLTYFPQAANDIKSFEDLKLYWTESYNLQFDKDIGKLHFESVKAAFVGIETVLKEFPPAARYLKEFGLLNAALMTTERGNGKINFNPEFFTDEQKLLATLMAGVRSGFYHKNMSPFSIGAHEAGHIVEDWLIAKYGVGNVSSRLVPRQIVRKAYKRAIQTAQGANKTIEQLKNELSYNASKNLSECLADAISDYLTNGEQAALLSREIWRVLKEELAKMTWAPGTFELEKFTFEEFERYGIFDDLGELIGVKDDAPPEFKEAYEHDKKKRAEFEALGID